MPNPPYSDMPVVLVDPTTRKAFASDNPMPMQSGITVFKDVTLSLDTSVYANGDLLADSQIVDGAVRVADGTGVIESISVLDEDDQTAYAFYLVFFSANVSMGTENAAPTMADADARNFLGAVSFATADAIDLVNSKVYQKNGLRVPIKAASGTDDIYMAAVVITGTPTHTASGVRVRLGIRQD
jgi:hypothetical protein